MCRMIKGLRLQEIRIKADQETTWAKILILPNPLQVDLPTLRLNPWEISKEIKWPDHIKICHQLKSKLWGKESLTNSCLNNNRLQAKRSMNVSNLLNKSQAYTEASYSYRKELLLEDLITRRNLTTRRCTLHRIKLSKTPMTNLAGCISRLLRKWKMTTMRHRHTWTCQKSNVKKLSVPNQPKEKDPELWRMMTASLSLRYALKTMSNIFLTEISIKILKNAFSNNACSSRKNWKIFISKHKLEHWEAPQTVPEANKKAGLNRQLKNKKLKRRQNNTNHRLLKSKRTRKQWWWITLLNKLKWLQAIN